MTASIENIKKMMKSLNMSYSIEYIDELLKTSNEMAYSYEMFIEELLKNEIYLREKKKLNIRLKYASFPEYMTLDKFDLKEQQSLSQRQLNQLKELTWIEQGYNLILLGPPGVGKTHIAVGLGIQAVNYGYKVIFTQMNDLVHLLKTAEILRTSKTKIKRIIDSDLLIIDDLMFMAMDRNEANLFFQLVNKLYDQTSIIITSNKGPEEWGELIGDPAITTAILDRIVHKCELINLSGDSYRIKHRESIFGKY
ncbi:MAG: IS21-like element helper ATPase IstB [Thermoanaerobacteraceae bacterium]|nr:IS21-like element helper ATPase IstB [Thermoanaerobacteraceae bacterium]